MALGDALVVVNNNQTYDLHTYMYMSEASEWAVDIWSDAAMQSAVILLVQVADTKGLDWLPVYVTTN